MDIPLSNGSMFEDEDEMLMQAAPNDTYLALQLLRSQFPAKARVGIFPSEPSTAHRTINQQNGICIGVC